jgi:hypothetical protein
VAQEGGGALVVWFPYAIDESIITQVLKLTFFSF